MLNNLRDTYFDVESKSGLHIHIPLLDKVVVIAGHSATGKTMMLNQLRALQDNPSEVKSSNIPLNKIRIVSHRADLYDSNGLINLSDTLIFIDRYPIVVNDEIEEFMRESLNKFVVFSHAALDNVPTSIFSLLALEYDFNTDTYSTIKLTKSNQWI
jgi:hypothetical protein